MKYVLSLTPVIFLMAFLGIVIHVYGTDALSGGSQLALILSTGVCGLIAVVSFHVPWKTLETEINNSIGSVGTAIVILLLIGLLSGTWTVSGVVPTLIYWGMKIINPYVFLLCCCVISGFVSVMTGSSWTTVATIGIALMGIGKALGFSDGWTAGAILSGAYFGDKMSPLSDTTVLASSVVGTPLFTHIRYMTITTVPGVVIALIVYAIAGLFVAGHSAIDTSAFTMALQSKYNLSPWLLIVPIATGLMIARKLPAIIVLFASSVLAGLFAIFFQPHILAEVIGAHDTTVLTLFKGVMLSGFGATAGTHRQHGLRCAAGHTWHAGHDGYGMADPLCHLLRRCLEGQWHACQHHAPAPAADAHALRTGCLYRYLRHLLQHYRRRSVSLYHAQRQHVQKYL